MELGLYATERTHLIQHGDVSQHSNVSLWWRDILQPRNAFNHGSDAINGFYAAARSNGDPSVLNCPQIDAEDDHPILRREVEAAVQSLKKGSQLESTTSQQNWSKQVERM